MSDDKQTETPAVRSAGNMGTTSESRQADAVDNTEDKPGTADSGTQADASSKANRGTHADKSSKAHSGTPATTAPAKATAKPSEGPDAWDRATDWFLAYGALPALAILTIAVFSIHAHIFWGETAGDDLSFHFAEAARLTDCVRHGDFDFWNPSANAGYASAYYYQVLPQLASAVPAAIFGHHLFWFQLSVVLPLVLAPACAYRGMRVLGATPWQSVAAAFAVAFMNGQSRWGAGNAGTFQVGLYTQTWALCFFPIALAYAAQWMMKGKHLAAAIAWGAFVFLCHPFAGITLGIAVLTAWVAQLVLIPFDLLFAAIAPKLRGRLAWFGKRWAEPPRRVVGPELMRGAILALLYLVSWMAVWLPLLIDGSGFGGFPHRVADEVGPGFKGLWHWYWSRDASILDFLPQNLNLGYRVPLLTWLLPAVILFARGSFYRWLWAPALAFALLLGLGPHLGKIGDDLIPPVRFLGGMQTVLAMGIGAGVVIVGQRIWDLVGQWPRHAYAIRTALAAAAAASIVLVAVPGTRALSLRVRVLEDHANSYANELFIINQILADQPQGRRQSGPSAENHWWNLLPYAYKRVPTTLQMGGGGLQASPNYDFLWTQRDYVKNAWVFDAPYLVFMSSQGSKMPIGQTVAKLPFYEVRRLPSPGLVSPVQVTGDLPPGYHHNQEGHKKALDWIKSDAPLHDEVLAYAGDHGNRAPPAGKMVRAWRQDSPGSDPDIVAELEVDQTTTFAVRESWHPRWHAYLDDEEVPVRRVTPDFPAVDVPPGKHTLAMRFERPWWAQAAWLAWPLTALAAWFWQRRRRRAPDDAAARALRAAA